MKRTTITLCAVAALFVVAACGDDQGASTADGTRQPTSRVTSRVTTPDTVDTGDADNTTSPTTVPPTATAPPSTEAPTTAPETTVAPVEAPTTTTPEESDVACGTLAPIPASARTTSSALVDWDGDGNPEATATVYETADGNRDFRLRVEGPTGGSEMAIITDDVIDPFVYGGVQVDFSLGSDQPQPQEILAAVSSNSSGFNLGVFYKDDSGCLARFTAADESPLELPIHASVGTASGLFCDGAAGSQFIVRTTATAGAGSGEYDVHDIRLRREGSALVDDVDIPGLIVDDGSPESPFLRYSSVANCGLFLGDD